jgi:hypothetical protein
VPSEAPDILIGSVVNVVFASHYGVSARQEILVSTYGEQTSVIPGRLGNSGLGGYIVSDGIVG